MGATSVRVTVVDLDVDRARGRCRPSAGSTAGAAAGRLGQMAMERAPRQRPRSASSGPGNRARWHRSGSTAGRSTTAWSASDGRLLSDPHSYRSPRTEGWRDVARSLGEADLYRRTGIQLLPINTIFQLAAHDPDELARATRLVMLPELVAYELTGEAVASAPTPARRACSR